MPHSFLKKIFVRDKNKTFSRYPTFASGLVSQYIYQLRKTCLIFNICYANLGTGILLPSFTIPCVKHISFVYGWHGFCEKLFLEFCSEYLTTHNQLMILIISCKHLYTNMVFTVLRRDQPTKCTEIVHFFIFLFRWLLHVSAKQCHPQGATMFLSEPLQRQYGRRQVGVPYSELRKVHYQVHTVLVYNTDKTV
jgi:hypothetical protein